VDRIVEHFFHPEPREAFIQDYKALQTAYEILSPDPFLRDYIDRYALVTQVYLVLYNAFSPESQRRRAQYEVLQKTDALIRERVEVKYLAAPLPRYPITRDIARVVAADNVSDQVKVINLYRSLMAHVEQHQAQRPYLISIGEEVEAILEQLHDRQISAQLALQRMRAAADQTARADEEQQQSDLPGPAFALYWVLRGSGVPVPRARAREVERVLDAHSDWPYNEQVRRQARTRLYKLLMDDLGRDAARLKEVVDHLLRMHRTVSG
jgi:type I restriction enzyme R subunit